MTADRGLPDRSVPSGLPVPRSHFGTPWHVRNVLPLEDLLHMATQGGATALGMGKQLGSLEAGKRADIILVNPDHWDMQPCYDPMFTVARGSTGRDVDSVIVDGRLVVRHGALLTVDEQELRARLAGRWPAIMDRFESIAG
jgi:cytosine/adenosine deaminase-related metal-dependent hydrolase